MNMSLFNTKFKVFSTENPNYPNGTTYCNDFDGVLDAITFCVDVMGYSKKSVKVIRNTDTQEIPISLIYEISDKINALKKSIENYT